MADRTDLEIRAAAFVERLDRVALSPPDDPLGFESRLADDNGWTLGYAIEVTAEYRRFLVLTQVAGRMVSPSPDVDEAWHLHLTRTVDYERMCRDVFDRFLHHEPARAGAAEAKRHRTMYAETLDAYRAAFGMKAPRPIWPAPGQRDAVTRVPPPPSTWRLPQPLRGERRLALASLAAALGAGVVLQSTGLARLLPTMAGPSFVVLATGVTALLAALAWRSRLAPTFTATRDVLEPYEAAWLTGGAPRMTATAIATLVARGVLRVRDPATPGAGALPPLGIDMTVALDCRHPVEHACLSAVADGGLRHGAASRAVEAMAWRVEQRLVAAGLAREEAALPPLRVLALGGMVALLCLETERLVAAMGTQRPVGFLVALMVAAVVGILVMSQPRRRASGRAEAVLKKLRLANGAARKTPREGRALSLAVALMGAYAVTADPRFAGLAPVLGAAPLVGRRDRATGAGDGGANSDSGYDGSSCGGGSSCASSDGGSSDGGGGSSCSSSSSDGGSSGCGGGGD